MNNIRILDCTLRDGGYINNWEFGCKNIETILTTLNNAKIDFIECGYLKCIEYQKDKTLYSEINQLLGLINQNKISSYCALMINYGEYPIEKIPEATEEKLMFRVTFKKEMTDEALVYCDKLIEKGYKIFIHPMHTATYSAKELNSLLEKINKINPFGVTIVDTTGSMQKNNLKSIFKSFDRKLNQEILIAFHSHNNLGLSVENAKELIKITDNRSLVIDSTILGIGRGAGNLPTEILIEEFGNRYNKEMIMELGDNIIKPIYPLNEGKKQAYYYSAINFCHPNYATYLSEKNIPDKDINIILQSIPREQRLLYDKNLVEKLLSTIS